MPKFGVQLWLSSTIVRRITPLNLDLSASRLMNTMSSKEQEVCLDSVAGDWDAKPTLKISWGREFPFLLQGTRLSGPERVEEGHHHRSEQDLMVLFLVTQTSRKRQSSILKTLKVGVRQGDLLDKRRRQMFDSPPQRRPLPKMQTTRGLDAGSPSGPDRN
jgi:hypothetical protein